MCQQGFDLRRKQERAVFLNIKERLHSDAIPCNKQPPYMLFPYRERKDTVQALHAALFPLNIGVQQNLSVRVPTKPVP